MFFTNHVSGIRLPDYNKFTRNHKNGSYTTICRNDVLVFFWRFRACPVKFSYCFKFHVNIITSLRVRTMFVYKGLTRNQEIENTPVYVLPNNWRLWKLRNTKFGKNFSNDKLLNASRVTAFTASELLREN